MGAYVSKDQCYHHYGIQINCTISGPNHYPNGTVDPPYTNLGGVEKGQFQGDPDIAGAGVLGVFIGVTGFALVAAIIDLGWQFNKKCCRSDRKQKERKSKTNKTWSFCDLLETLVLTCSDQQMFVGAAYALTLRYWKGCDISAYHYNLVCNMMLLTCATHLMAVTIVRNYWRYPWLALLRILCISGVFIITGLLLTNQNADEAVPFPTGLPGPNDNDSLIFMPAACFQSAENTAGDTIKASTSSAHAFFDSTLVHSTPDNMIQGWNWFLAILLYYGAAIIAEVIRLFRRAKSRPGWRGKVGNWFGGCFSGVPFLRRSAETIFFLYLCGGVGIGVGATFVSARYMLQLRAWVADSGWMARENNMNPEDDATTFGQLVPIFTCCLIAFTFATIISENVTGHGNNKHEGEKFPNQDGTIGYLDPTHYDLVQYQNLPPSNHRPSIQSLSNVTSNGGKSQYGKNETMQATTTEYLGAGGLALIDPATPSFAFDQANHPQWPFKKSSMSSLGGSMPATPAPVTTTTTAHATRPGRTNSEVIAEDPDRIGVAAPLLGRTDSGGTEAGGNGKSNNNQIGSLVSSPTFSSATTATPGTPHVNRFSSMSGMTPMTPATPRPAATTTTNTTPTNTTSILGALGGGTGQNYTPLPQQAEGEDAASWAADVEQQGQSQSQGRQSRQSRTSSRESLPSQKGR